MRGLWEMEDFVRRAQFTSGTFQGHFLGQSYIVCFCNCSLNVFRSILRRSNARGRYCCATTKRSRAAWKNWAWNTPRFSAIKTIVRRLSGWCRSRLKTARCVRFAPHQVPRLYLQHVSHAFIWFQELCKLRDRNCRLQRKLLQGKVKEKAHRRALDAKENKENCFGLA